MINTRTINNTLDVLDNLFARQGGSLFFNSVSGGVLIRDTTNYKTAVKVPPGAKEFSISIYNVDTDKDISRLVLYINPKDITIGQLHSINSSYTRRGWVNVAWGNQQATISASGISSGFYFYNGSKGGLTNYYRRISPSFLNILDIVGLFKNNGWYNMDGETNPSLFRDGTSRVINVMDCIKIEYDGSIYIGSFNTLTLNDVAEKPYNMEYNFEFIVSSFGTDLQGVDGHLSRNNNKDSDQVQIAIQGFNLGFKSVIGLDSDEVARYFTADSIPDPSSYDYDSIEQRDEEDFFSRYKESGYYDVPDGQFRITRGWLDSEDHNKKCDFRTGSGGIYAAINGTVYKVRKSYVRGGSNYIITISEWKGKRIYVRYYHLNPDSIEKSEGDTVSLGDLIGFEGTDGGKYPPHCDFEVREISDVNPDYFYGKRLECSPILDAMWNEMHEKAVKEPDNIKYQDFKDLVVKHPPKMRRKDQA